MAKEGDSEYQNEELIRLRLKAEAGRLHESAIYSAQGQVESAKVWRRMHWYIGGFTAASSAVAAVLTFSTDELQLGAGILAIAASISAAVHTTMNPDKRAERAELASNDYTALRDDLRQFGLIRSLQGDLRALEEDLQRLTAKASDINHRADPIPRFAYKAAKKNIEVEGGQRFEVDA